MSTRINLLPWREELKEQQKKEFILISGLGCFVALLLLVLVHLIMVRSIDSQMSNNNYLRQEIAILDKKILEIKELKDKKEKLLARMQIIQELQSNRPRIVQLFDGLTRTIPDGLYLTSVTRAHTKLLIDGRAESNTRVSTFMRNIEKSTWLKKPLLSLIQAEDAKKKDTQQKSDNMIDFNLEAIQVLEEAPE